MKKAAFIGGKFIPLVYSETMIANLQGFLRFPISETVTRQNLDAYRDRLQDVSYLFSTWGMPALNAEEIERYFPSLEAVFYAAGSVQDFARPFLEKGIAVFSAWAANAVPVAEFAAAEIVLASKGFFNLMYHHEDPLPWDRSHRGDLYPGNYDIKIGILGAGMIGKMVIAKLKAMDHLDILVFDPFLPEEAAQALGVTKASLQTIFAECAVISNHLANKEEIRGILNADCFDRMLPYAAFINTGRGAQVVEEDLIAAMKKEPNRVALLDVTWPEPPSLDSELYRLRNVILTPHLAGSQNNEFHRMAEYMYEECKAFDQGLPTRYGVTLAALETMA